jgi:AhpC/TSA family
VAFEELLSEATDYSNRAANGWTNPQQPAVRSTDGEQHGLARRIAPDFELKTTRGERFQLSENVGKKIIVLNFFAT